MKMWVIRPEKHTGRVFLRYSRLMRVKSGFVMVLLDSETLHTEETINGEMF
jgi:hypothetical protein